MRMGIIFQCWGLILLHSTDRLPWIRISSRDFFFLIQVKMSQDYLRLHSALSRLHGSYHTFVLGAPEAAVNNTVHTLQWLK